jgi:hypothetical protein
MPNVKIFIDETIYPACRKQLTEALNPLRDMLCDRLKVDMPACQFAVLPVSAIADQPRVNVEMQILPKPERTREVVLDVCRKVKEMVGAATSTHVAVRVVSLDPDTYIALK